MTESEPAEPGARDWSARALGMSGSVYGTILASSLLVALGYRTGDALVMIAVLLVTEVVFLSAHAWSALLGSGAARGRLPTLHDLRGAVGHEWPVLQATWPAVTSLALAALGAFSTDTAIDIALVLNAAILFLWGLALGRLHGVSLASAAAAGAFTCALGVALVVLKVLVH